MSVRVIQDLEERVQLLEKKERRRNPLNYHGQLQSIRSGLRWFLVFEAARVAAILLSDAFPGGMPEWLLTLIRHGL